MTDQTPRAGAPSVYRFAPSPNGRLHLGHALSALICHGQARRAGGRFLLRIEDIDIGRCRPEHIDGIIEDLTWLGLDWDGPVLRQSEHFDIYRAATRRLQALGVLYPCFATRREIAEAVVARGDATARDPDGAPLYPGLFKGRDEREILERLARGEPHALRLDMARAREIAARALAGGDLAFTETGFDGEARRVVARPERWGDAIIVRKDVPTSYHLAVVVDDARQAVTHVTRGRDLLAATDLHRLLQVLLDLPEPVYHHHRLIADAAGRKLSKSAGDTSLAALRELGVTPAEIRRMVDSTQDAG